MCWYVREAGNLSAAAALETDSGQQLSPDRIETPNRSLFLRDARLTLDVPRWVHECGQVGCGIGTTSHARIHSRLFIFFGVTFHQGNTMFTLHFFFRTFSYIFVLFSKCF